ncbi:hypothetical protein NDU88_001387 [Pleurodeles waltl]|uniref:Uncharacterized protein n=1 Tax=Pleurodeles waltl TaxID=8319 RepID=A0AAV7P7S1_PLEWA|nr:hypothetical protein NDU88_001387 [Pleurodeles waltl]
MLRGRHLFNKLSSMWVIAEADPDKSIPNFESIKHKVVSSQMKAKSRYDELKKVKEVDFKVEDRVRIKRPYNVRGSKYFHETKIVQVSKHSVKVVRGKWLSKRNVAKVYKGVDVQNFQSQNRGSGGCEIDLRRANDLQDVVMFYETGVTADDDDGREQGEVINHAQCETPCVDVSQDAEQAKNQHAVQDKFLNRFPSKRVINKPKYLDDFVWG